MSMLDIESIIAKSPYHSYDWLGFAASLWCDSYAVYYQEGDNVRLCDDFISTDKFDLIGRVENIKKQVPAAQIWVDLYYEE